MTIDDIMPLLQSEDIEDNILGVILGAKARIWQTLPLLDEFSTIKRLITIPCDRNYSTYRGDVIVQREIYILRSDLLIQLNQKSDVSDGIMLYNDGSLKQYTDGKG